MPSQPVQLSQGDGYYVKMIGMCRSKVIGDRKLCRTEVIRGRRGGGGGGGE